MSITYTWKIKEVKVRDEGNNKNAIVQTYWQKIGTDENGNEGIFEGATPFKSSDEFIPFDNLTEDMVIGWVQNYIANSFGYEEHINLVIENQINDKKTPITNKPLPWAPVVDE